MLPDYANSGGKGRMKALTNNKVGRPRRVNISGNYQTGINITGEVKLQFEHAINKYYRKTNNYSLKTYIILFCVTFIQTAIKKMVKYSV